jgi:hypothetical protein
MVAFPDMALYGTGDRVGMLLKDIYGAIKAAREHDNGWADRFRFLSSEDLEDAEVVPDRFGDSRSIDSSLSAVCGGEPLLVGTRSSTRIACGAAVGDLRGVVERRTVEMLDGCPRRSRSVGVVGTHRDVAINTVSVSLLDSG